MYGLRLIAAAALAAIAAMFGITDTLYASYEQKPRYLWIETGANLLTLASREKIAEMLDKAKAAGITHIVPEAKNAWGTVIYESDFAPHIRDSSTNRIWPPGEYSPPKDWFPKDYDTLSVLIEEAHKRGIKVNASVNCFSEGLDRTQEGQAFSRPEWQSVYFVANRNIIAPNGKFYSITRVGGNRGWNELVLYPSGSHKLVPTNQWGIELSVKDDEVADVFDRQITQGPQVPVPDSGYVLSGNGAAREFLKSNFRVGSRVRLGPVETSFAKSGETGTFAFVNVAHPEVQLYQQAILHELVSKYPVDGVILDRCRWWNYYADFSDYNRFLFEEFLGRRVENWPQDILSYEPTRFFYAIKRGLLWQDWQAWRAKVMHQFFRSAAVVIRKTRPGIEVGNYVGGWYPFYWREGVNWGAAGYDPGFEWANATWIASGTAEFFDYLMVGAYYPEVFESESIALGQPAWMSVEGVAKLARAVTMGKTKIINSLNLEQFEKRPERMREAIKMSEAASDGVMLFDLVFMEKFGWWPLFEND